MSLSYEEARKLFLVNEQFGVLLSGQNPDGTPYRLSVQLPESVVNELRQTNHLLTEILEKLPPQGKEK